MKKFMVQKEEKMAINTKAIIRYKKGLCPECAVRLEYEAFCFCPQCGEDWNGDRVLRRYFNPEKNCSLAREKIIDSLSGL